MVRILGCAAVFLAATAGVAKAEYPYTGYFTVFYNMVAPEDVLLGCALHSFVQNDDGSSRDFVLDVDFYKKKKKIRFVTPFETHCTYIESHTTEFCHSTEHDASGKKEFDFAGYTLDLKSDPAKSILFGDMTEYYQFFASSNHTYEPGKYQSATLYYIYRCPAQTGEAIAPHVERNRFLPSDMTDKLSGDPQKPIAEYRSIVEDVAKALFQKP